MVDYSMEEVSTICGEIHKRISGGMNDESFISFNKMITPVNLLCKGCEDTGVAWDGKGLTVCRRCSYHFRRGRTLSIAEPDSIKAARIGKR